MTGVELIAEERRQQFLRDGDTDAKHDSLKQRELAKEALERLKIYREYSTLHHDGGLEQLIRAGALIAAEIDRIQRAQGSEIPPGVTAQDLGANPMRWPTPPTPLTQEVLDGAAITGNTWSTDHPLVSEITLSYGNLPATEIREIQERRAIETGAPSPPAPHPATMALLHQYGLDPTMAVYFEGGDGSRNRATLSELYPIQDFDGRYITFSHPRSPYPIRVAIIPRPSATLSPPDAPFD